MITRTDLHIMNLNSIEQYFNSIVQCGLRKQLNQVDSLILNLSRKQRIDALRYYYAMMNNTRVMAKRQAIAYVFSCITDYMDGTKKPPVAESGLQLKLGGM